MTLEDQRTIKQLLHSTTKGNTYNFKSTERFINFTGKHSILEDNTPVYKSLIRIRDLVSTAESEVDMLIEAAVLTKKFESLVNLTMLKTGLSKIREKHLRQ